MSFMKKYALKTQFEGMHEITAQIQEAVKESGVQEGFCIVHSNHTTASLLVTSFWDKRGHVDFMEEIDKLIPTRYDYRHQFDTPTDAAGHIKSALGGTTLTLIVTGGKSLLGSSQGVLFAEFDGPRDRQFFVKVVAD